MAEQAGLAEGRAVPGMVLYPLQGQPPEVPDLDIRSVDDVARIEPYNETMATGSGIDKPIMEMLHHPAFLAAPGVRMHLGFVDGQPVTTALSYCVNRIALVFNISTIPATGGVS